jgi:GNAT superfamily N-acetyltransferase
MLHIEVLTLRALRSQVKDLAISAFKNVSIYKDTHRIKVNWGAYEGFEKLGLLVCLGAFDGDKLVGYAAVIRAPAIHCTAITLGIVQALFVHPDYRKRGFGLRSTGSLLLDEIELAARATKCTHIVINVPRDQKKLGNLLVHRGYGLKELAFVRRV